MEPVMIVLAVIFYLAGISTTCILMSSSKRNENEQKLYQDYLRSKERKKHRNAE